MRFKFTVDRWATDVLHQDLRRRRRDGRRSGTVRAPRRKLVRTEARLLEASGSAKVGAVAHVDGPAEAHVRERAGEAAAEAASPASEPSAPESTAKATARGKAAAKPAASSAAWLEAVFPNLEDVAGASEGC